MSNSSFQIIADDLTENLKNNDGLHNYIID